MARKPISADTICVDEVECYERDRLYLLISNIFHLVYAEQCVTPIYAERKEQCYGCETNHPSQIHHDCLMLSEEESWNLFYDNAKDAVDAEEVWKHVLGVCYMKDITLHRSWKTYLTELYKLPWTMVYLLRRQLLHYDSELSPVEKVLIVLSKETSEMKTQDPIHCPEEVLRKEVEPMELDVKFRNLKI
jgi:hypothetical protein